MDLHVSVFLLFALFAAGQALSCYECVGLTGCTYQTEKACPVGASHCESSTITTQIGVFSSTANVKDCSAVCANGSMNIGVVKMSSECCNTDRCNVRDAPDPSTDAPNGHSCYSCDELSCSNILSCSGTEDRCITATGSFEDQSLTVKGCASQSICDATASVSSVRGVSCCEGNLCNGAVSVTQSVLFLCFSLLSFILVH